MQRHLRPIFSDSAMKPAIFTIVLLMTAFCAACEKPVGLASSAAPFDGNAAQALIQTERDRIAAMSRADTANLERILAANFRYTDPDGRQFTRIQTSDELTSGELKFDAYESSEFNIQFYQNAAVIFGLYRFIGDYLGRGFDEQVRCTNFFIKQDGRWMAVASQASRMTQQQ